MIPTATPSMLEQIVTRLQDAWTFARVDEESVTLPELAVRMNQRGWDYDRRGPFGGREAVTGRVLDTDELAELVAEVRRRHERDHPAPDSRTIQKQQRGRSFIFGPADAEWLRARYHDDGWSLARIGDDRGCSYATVRNALIRLGIPLRTKTLIRDR